MGVVGLVLLIACANLASLLTARAASTRRRSRSAGHRSSRGRMIQQLLTESCYVATPGALPERPGGSALPGLPGLPPTITGYSINSTRSAHDALHLRPVALDRIAFGLAPALQSTRPNIATTLKDQAGGVVGGGAPVRLRKALVAAQVSLSLLLLIGAGLFVRSLANLRTLNPGFQTGNLIQFSVSPGSVGYNDASGEFSAAPSACGAPPGCAAPVWPTSPLANSQWDNSITIGAGAKPGEEMDPHFNAVSPGYFDTLGIHLLAGRVFTVKDELKGGKVAIVNAAFVKRYFGDGIAVGRRFGRGSDPGTPTDIEIVGVVNDTRYESLRDEMPLLVYICSAQVLSNAQTVYVRTERDPDSAFGAIRAALHELDPNLPATGMKTLETARRIAGDGAHDRIAIDCLRRARRARRDRALRRDGVHGDRRSREIGSGWPSAHNRGTWCGWCARGAGTGQVGIAPGARAFALAGWCVPNSTASSPTFRFRRARDPPARRGGGAGGIYSGTPGGHLRPRAGVAGRVIRPLYDYDRPRRPGWLVRFGPLKRIKTPLSRLPGPLTSCNLSAYIC
jgi:hypothetical protein